MYSLFQKYNARSATYLYNMAVRQIRFFDLVNVWWRIIWMRYAIDTWKCELATHLAICLNNGTCTAVNWVGSITSSISSISPKNITWDSENRINFLFSQKYKARIEQTRQINLFSTSRWSWNRVSTKSQELNFLQFSCHIFRKITCPLFQLVDPSPFFSINVTREKKINFSQYLNNIMQNEHLFANKTNVHQKMSNYY